MEYLLFAGYLFLFSWLVTRLGFFKKSGLSNAQLIILFLLKIITGIFYGWVGLYYGQFAYMFDTWAYHYASLDEYKLLFSHPAEYVTNLFQSGYEHKYSGFFDSDNSWWNDLKSNMLIKIVSVFDIFSFGNYYINVIFYSFISYIGPVAIYRVFNDVFPGKKIQVLLATFLIPSFIYWTSGIHKDGLVFMAVALIIYQFYFGFFKNQYQFRRIISVVVSFIIIISFRNFLLFIICPAFIAWYFSVRKPHKTLSIFLLTYIVCGILFFTLRYITPSLDFPQAVVEKQEAFKKLQGNSTIDLPELQPTVISFIKNAPNALGVTTLHPHPGDIKHILSFAATTETLFLLFLLILFLIWRKNGIRSKAFVWFCMFFSFSLLLTIGYTVNFLGAIVRYRSIVLPFLMVPVVAMIDWQKVYGLLFNNIKKNNNV